MKKEKLYLATTGEEVTLGKDICIDCNCGGMTCKTIIFINEDSVPILKQSGILVTTPPVTGLNDIDLMSKAIERIAKRLDWKPQKAERYINTLVEVMPMAAFNLMAREIAIILDQKYEDHIEKSDKIYVISSLDGRIHEVNKKHIKNYRNFAAFRTVEDAKLACSILREPLKAMFKSGK